MSPLQLPAETIVEVNEYAISAVDTRYGVVVEVGVRGTQTTYEAEVVEVIIPGPQGPPGTGSGGPGVDLIIIDGGVPSTTYPGTDGDIDGGVYDSPYPGSSPDVDGGVL